MSTARVKDWLISIGLGLGIFASAVGIFLLAERIFLVAKVH